MMKITRIIPLILLVLGVMWVSWAIGQGISCTGTTPGTIQVTDADTISCFAVGEATDLLGRLNAVVDRIVLQYADTNRQTVLVDVPQAFAILLQAARDRIVLQYADTNRQTVLVDVPQAFATLLQAVADRIIMHYADANQTHALRYPEALINDTKPPQISHITLTPIFTDTAGLPGQLQISWETDEFTTTAFEYGLSSGQYEMEFEQTAHYTRHSVLLDNLVFGQTYFYRIRAIDRSGNVSLSAEEFTMIPERGLAASKTVRPYLATPNDVLTYTLWVTNTGNVVLNATIIDDLPPVLLTAAITEWQTRLPPAELWTHILTAQVPANYAGAITNVLRVHTLEGISITYTLASTTEEVVNSVYLPMVLK